MALKLKFVLCQIAILSGLGSSQSQLGNSESEMTYLQLFDKMTKMEETFQSRLRGFQKMTDNLNAMVSDLHDKNDNLLSFITEQDRRITNLESEKSELESKIAMCDTKVSHLVNQQRYKNSTVNRERRTTVSHPNVAFHATLTRKLSVTDGQHLHIDNVLTNSGNGYSSGSGTFTCPSTGTYVFTATVLAMQSKYVETEIVRNGVSIAKLFSGGYQYFNSGSNTVVVNLHHGDKVWLRVIDQWHDDGVVVDSAWTTFTGFQLY